MEGLGSFVFYVVLFGCVWFFINRLFIGDLRELEEVLDRHDVLMVSVYSRLDDCRRLCSFLRGLSFDCPAGVCDFERLIGCGFSFFGDSGCVVSDLVLLCSCFSGDWLVEDSVVSGRFGLGGFRCVRVFRDGVLFLVVPLDGDVGGVVLSGFFGI